MVMAVSVIGGLFSAYQQDQSQQAGEKYQQDANANAKNQIALAEQQQQEAQFRYNEFTNLYGDMNQNIADYYTNLSADVYTTGMNDAISKQYDIAATSMREDMASRGINGSGIEAQAMGDLQYKKADAEANAIGNADQWVAEQQSSYMTQQNQRTDNSFGAMQLATNNTINSMGNLTNSYNNQANTSFNQATQYGNSAVSGIGQGMYGMSRSTSVNTNVYDSNGLDADGFSFADNQAFEEF